MADKKLKIEIPDSALKNVPEEEREAVKAQIIAMFEGMHPNDIATQTKPVYHLEKKDGLVCLKCKGPLKPFRGSCAMPDARWHGLSALGL